MLQCSNGNYYAGYTNNLENRIKEHDSGHGAKYLRGKGPVKLVYVKEYKYYKRAIRKEREIKRLTRKEKEGLIRKYARNEQSKQK